MAAVSKTARVILGSSNLSLGAIPFILVRFPSVLTIIAEVGSEIFAIEVKTEKKRRARSLKKMMEMDAGRNISRWVRFEYGNIMLTEDGVEHYPLFCAAFAGLLTSKTEVHLTRADHDLVI